MPSQPTIFNNANQRNSEVSRPESTTNFFIIFLITAYPNSELQKKATENGCAKALREVNKHVIEVHVQKERSYKKMGNASGYNK